MMWLKIIWLVFTGILLAFPLGFLLYILFKWLKGVFNVMKKKLENIKALEKMKDDLLKKSAGEYISGLSEDNESLLSSTEEDKGIVNKTLETQEKQSLGSISQNKVIKNNVDVGVSADNILDTSSGVSHSQGVSVLSDKDRQELNALIFKVDALKNDGKIEEYEKKIIEGLSIDPYNLTLSKKLADLYFSRQEYKKALSLLKQIIEKDPEDHASLWQIGEIYLSNQDYQTAELLIDKAIDLNTESPKYYMSMVEVYYSTERKIEAVQIMEKVIKLRPDNPKYLQLLAEIYDELGDEDNAVKYYFRLLENDPSNPQAKKRLNS